MDKEELLRIPIAQLAFSKGFTGTCKKMGLNTITEILAMEPGELIKLDDFDYNWLGELVKFLSENGLLYRLQPLPGNIPY